VACILFLADQNFQRSTIGYISNSLASCLSGYDTGWLWLYSAARWLLRSFILFRGL